jgi:hypothetical protein
MVLKDIINKSWYVANGFVDSINSIELLEGYILYNLPVLQEFKGIIIATTYKNYPNLVEENKNLWKKYFPNCILIDIEVNRGHSFGIADSENALIEYCKENNIDWICKSSNDVIIQESILYKEIKEADLYYTNGISYEDLYLNNFDYEKIYSEHFFPQTNFYFIRVDKIDYLYNKDYVNETYQYRLTIPNYSNKIWEYFPEWACELFLKRCVERNNLSKYYLLDKEKHNQLCETVSSYKIGDPSHKNIMIDGVCHFQFPDQQILEI